MAKRLTVARSNGLRKFDTPGFVALARHHALRQAESAETPAQSGQKCDHSFNSTLVQLFQQFCSDAFSQLVFDQSKICSVIQLFI